MGYLHRQGGAIDSNGSLQPHTIYLYTGREFIALFDLELIAHIRRVIIAFPTLTCRLHIGAHTRVVFLRSAFLVLAKRVSSQVGESCIQA
jgi:hypothetical protein